jgi:hypothetical protein
MYPKAGGVLPALRRAIPAPRDPDGIRLDMRPRRIGWAIKLFIVWARRYDNGRGAWNRTADIEVIGEANSGLDRGGQDDENYQDAQDQLLAHGHPLADMEQSRSCGILFDIIRVYITRKGSRKRERACDRFIV